MGRFIGGISITKIFSIKILGLILGGTYIWRFTIFISLFVYSFSVYLYLLAVNRLTPSTRSGFHKDTASSLRTRLSRAPSKSLSVKFT